MTAALALQIVPSDVQMWREAFGRLDPRKMPCPGFTASRWTATHEAVQDFLDHHAEQAAEFGYSALDLFGVHPSSGVIRLDYCGALMIGTLKARAVEPTRISFGALTYYRDVPGCGVGVPVWAFKDSR